MVLSSYDDPLVRDLIGRYFDENEAARVFADESERKGWPLVIDHITIRCLNVDRRAEPFLKGGYVYRDEMVEYPDQGWWAKVYRRPGYPALFIDQAYDDPRGEKSIIPEWVKKFGDRSLHHVAVRVDDIEKAVSALEKRGVEFSGSIVGNRGTRLRQIFTASEVRDGSAYSVLELAERNGYDGFYPEQADSLMQASVKKKSK
ncbi:MAG TPA: VOC family protein [Candidatus Manganitrophaceae bacterium]|nr:VOC family protein [Candidatus Manganitrophaceae bacterium]